MYLERGTIIDDTGVYVIHPFPDRHAHRAKRGTENETGVHVVFKREAVVPVADFCGLDNVVTEEQLTEDDSAIFEDVFVTGQRLQQMSDLVVELAVFVDETLWRHFSSKYGSQAHHKLQDYMLTLLNNIQIMYYQPSASPPLTFRVIRYECWNATRRTILSIKAHHELFIRPGARGKNCLRVSNMPTKLTIPTNTKPGQIYDANLQCELMHGPGYQQVTPRQDAFDGICYMMWCGQSSFGRIITSHPALEGHFTLSEPVHILSCFFASTMYFCRGSFKKNDTTAKGTFCGPNKWCQLGKCVPWNGNRNTATTSPTANMKSLSPQVPSSPAWVVPKYITEKCTEHKKLKNDQDLTGSGSQLNRFPQRACKVFCDVANRLGGQRNYRFFGDNLPDGTSCGYDRYCLDGECLPLSCSSNALIGRDLSCPTETCPSDNLPLWKGEWGQWSLWTTCTVTCDRAPVPLKEDAMVQKRRPSTALKPLAQKL
ncbi:unnamed protein product [Strongylus vulgaris]|uniref:Uncharacterized protein n=1 Tax=Strongylus vulgaris TaxID=40348 RepID=A0A3P7IZT1_STRVU|nr:unnamed protein product [Strongylus vulgaris]